MVSPQSPGSSDLLTRSHFGMHVTGRVDSVSDVQYRHGKTEKGGSYAFWQQTITLALGGLMVSVNKTYDVDPGTPKVHFDLDSIVRLKVEKPRVYNGAISFELAE